MADNEVVVNLEEVAMANPVVMKVRTVNMRRAVWRLRLSGWLVCVIEWLGVVEVVRDSESQD